MSDISYRIVIDERYEAEMNHLRIERNAAWRENAKLRELVSDMWAYMATPCDDYCDKCLSADKCLGHDECPKRGEYERRMVELGVEVDA